MTIDELILRPMTMVDADKMLEWKNYEETRRFAITSHDEIKKEDHYQWLAKNIQHFRVIQIADGGQLLGAIRVQDLEVSIWVDREFRNLGIAKKTLQLISGQGMWCKIVEGNLSSMRAFIYAGFAPAEYVQASASNYYIFRK